MRDVMYSEIPENLHSEIETSKMFGLVSFFVKIVKIGFRLYDRGIFADSLAVREKSFCIIARGTAENSEDKRCKFDEFLRHIANGLVDTSNFLSNHRDLHIVMSRSGEHIFQTFIFEVCRKFSGFEEYKTFVDKNVERSRLFISTFDTMSQQERIRRIKRSDFVFMVVVDFFENGNELIVRIKTDMGKSKPHIRDNNRTIEIGLIRIANGIIGFPASIRAKNEGKVIVEHYSLFFKK